MGYSKATSPFLNKVRRAVRIRRLSRSTEQSYLHYTIQFIDFHGKRPPELLGEADVRAYLDSSGPRQACLRFDAERRAIGIVVLV